MIGTSLNQFRITAKLGQGGMGEVFRATDTKLGREVAIKVLPGSFTQIHGAMARFEREAKALAALNHSNIASIHGFDCAQGTHFLVMELVEGETLEERLKGGPLTIEEALQIGQQIAEALESAHARGIVHRDLKPANIKITPDGRVKVLDFGLAKAMGDLPSSADVRPEDSPTLLGSVHSTMPGVILGTAAYMSPEQARGKPVDHRSDIWSFGVVLFECLTGRKLFSGESVSDILAGVLKSEIDWAALPAQTPPAIQWLIRKCLTRDKNLRLQDVADARVDLDRTLSGEATLAVTPALASKQSRIVRYSLLAAALALVAFLGGSYFQRRQVTPHEIAHPQTYTVNLAPEIHFGTLAPCGSSVHISPDCSKIVYLGVADGVYSLYWKQIQDANFTVIPQSTRSLSFAAFSRDSESIAFAKVDGEVEIFSFQGGLPRSIRRPAGLVTGLDWPDDSRLFYTSTNGLEIMHPNSPAPVPELMLACDPAAKELFGYPRVLPDGDTVLFNVLRADASRTLEAFNLRTKVRSRIPASAPFNVEFYRPTGHLLYGRDDVLWARPFDPRKLEFLGPEFPTLNDLGRDWRAQSHQFTIARNGTLIYGRGHQTDPRYSLVWVRNQGEPELLPVPAANYALPRLSPAGDLVVLDGPQSDSVLVRLETGLTFGLAHRDNFSAFIGNKGGHLNGAFAFDGTNYYANRLKGSNICVVSARVDGGGEEKILFSLPQTTEMVARAISPDHHYLAFQRAKISAERIFLKDLTNDSAPAPLAAADRSEFAPSFSPDGEWLAYAADSTDRFQVYVQRVSGGGLPIQVSRNGGAAPVWAPNGKSLYFTERIEKIMVAKIRTKVPLSFETPTLFANIKMRHGTGIIDGASYDVFSAPDGDRVLTLKSIYEEPQPHGASQLTAIVHFDEYLRRQTPVNK